MSEISANNRRIAKNTMYMYFRMLFMMVLSFYTSRVMLEVLGVEDYGIINVVGGVVGMIGFLRSAFSRSVQRYLNFAMGRGNEKELNKVFCVSFWTFTAIAGVCFIVAETAGLWFVNAKLNIPEERMFAANIIYQVSIASFILGLLTNSYNAAIIAHERMSIYAYLSILSAVFSLLILYMVMVTPFDRLVTYSFLLFAVHVIMAGIYVGIAHRLFKECRLHWMWDKKLAGGLLSFTGWVLFGTISSMLKNQAVNMIINIFFGLVYNAARAVAMSVTYAVESFVSNFMVTVKPQIVKTYAQGDREYLYKLVYSSSKISFYILFVLALPVLFNAERILSIWLAEVPEASPLFLELAIIDLLITTAYTPIGNVSGASGKVKLYQLAVSSSYFAMFMLTYVAYKLGAPVEAAFYISIALNIVGYGLRLLALRQTVGFSIPEYARKVMLPTFTIFVICAIPAFLLSLAFKSSGIVLFLLQFALCCAITCVIIYTLGLNKQERNLVLNFVRIKHKSH